MPDERVMADGVNLAYAPDEDPTATAGEAQAWKHGREVGRAEERNRLLNPSPELVEAATKVAYEFWYAPAQWPPPERDYRDSWLEMIGAALQAAAKEITES